MLQTTAKVNYERGDRMMVGLEGSHFKLIINPTGEFDPMGGCSTQDFFNCTQQ